MFVREMILADNGAEREAALEKIYPVQRQDFVSIFREMKGYPVTIRLLDPPLHEFLPHGDTEIKFLAKSLNRSVDIVNAKITSLRESNPMLGHRGCRLGISYPEIYRMQVRAIVDAACYLVKEEGFSIEPEIMVPLVSSVEELRLVKEDIVTTCEEVMKAADVKLDYKVGSMIEIPRAALVADEIAQESQFFSFGTNDLTQMTLGVSRDDAGSFLPAYVERGIYQNDPFVTLDQKGVGELMRMATKKGKESNPNLTLGICGEHGGDTATIEFCHRLGFNYVSCSPFRVPVARLAAAQATQKINSKSLIRGYNQGYSIRLIGVICV